MLWQATIHKFPHSLNEVGKSVSFQTPYIELACLLPNFSTQNEDTQHMHNELTLEQLPSTHFADKYYTCMTGIDSRPVICHWKEVFGGSLINRFPSW